MNTKSRASYSVYVLDDADSIFDVCGEGFNTVEEARAYITYLRKGDAARLINDEYAIYRVEETLVE